MLFSFWLFSKQFSITKRDSFWTLLNMVGHSPFNEFSQRSAFQMSYCQDLHYICRIFTGYGHHVGSLLPLYRHFCSPVPW